MTVNRTYLYVSPEEQHEVKALGAHWDNRLKCWYVDGNENSARFAKWLDEDDCGDDFTISSDEAFVAAATIACWQCHTSIEVICIYCESGTVSEEPLTTIPSSAFPALSLLRSNSLRWPGAFR